MDPKQVVAQGYDRVAERYIEWSRGVRVEESLRYLSLVQNELPEGARVLDLGCGAGMRARALAERFEVTGVDISSRLLATARREVPAARLLHADMTTVGFPRNSFDGVVAFYSIFHVPRYEQGPLLCRIAEWMEPGGLFVATLGSRSNEGHVEDNWLGAPMYWSSHNSQANRHMVEDAGFCIESASEETADEFGKPVTFFWVVARNTSTGVTTPAN